MTSKIKVDNINKVSDDSNIIKKCGTTTTIGSGASNPIVVDGSAITLGRCGGTVALASGATQTGFGRTGTVDWQTTPKTGTFTAVNGEGYFVDTSGAVSTANLPAGSAGAIVSFADYTRTFQTNKLTITPNGSEKIGGVADSLVLSTEGQSITLIYVDGTEGWINTNESTGESGGVPTFITATGGTITTVCTNFKVHTFTGPGTFTVCSVGNPLGSNTVQTMIVAGGGGGGRGSSHGAGAGAGGYRTSAATPVSAQGYPVVVGGGGPGAPAPSVGYGTKGSDSSAFSITSTGGGQGGGWNAQPGLPGGSGSGSASSPQPNNYGAGNTPSVSPPQGFPGGASCGSRMGGGGGAGEAGNTDGQGHGGDGAPNTITGSNVTYAGGGSAGGSSAGGDLPGGEGGGGVGGGPPGSAGGAGTANTGGGGGGAFSSQAGGSGGSGIVIIRYKFQ